VREHGELAVLRAGDHWPSDARSVLIPGAATSPIASPLGSLAPTPSYPSNSSPTSASNPASASTPASTPSPTSTSASTPAYPPLAHTATRPRVAPAPAPTPPPALTLAPVAPQDTSPLPPPEPTAQSRYETAARLERTDPARALRVYTELARGSDAWAQNALYAAGRLQADRGARTDAARLLEEYLRRFPLGSNAQDARALRESLR
jgi:hypothetical protein